MKRGIMFSLMAMVISTFVILLFWTSSTPRLDTMSAASETRVMVLDNHLSAWDAYIEDATRITTRAALLGLTNRVDATTTQMDVAKVKSNISSCLLTGQADYARSGTSWCFSTINQSLGAKLDNFTILAHQELGINTTHSIGNIEVSDWAPFEILVVFTMNYTVQDTGSMQFARWNRSKIFSVVVSIEGLPDPLFKRYGLAEMKLDYCERNITRYPVTRDRFNQANLTSLIEKRMYVDYANVAPTYLERMALIVNPAVDPSRKAGIETVLQPHDVSFGPTEYINMSFTDYQVFANKLFECPDKTIRTSWAPTMYRELYMDIAHWASYNINNTAFQYSCD